MVTKIGNEVQLKYAKLVSSTGKLPNMSKQLFSQLRKKCTFMCVFHLFSLPSTKLGAGGAGLKLSKLEIKRQSDSF